MSIVEEKRGRKVATKEASRTSHVSIGAVDWRVRYEQFRNIAFAFPPPSSSPREKPRETSANNYESSTNIIPVNLSAPVSRVSIAPLPFAR